MARVARLVALIAEFGEPRPQSDRVCFRQSRGPWKANLVGSETAMIANAVVARVSEAHPGSRTRRLSHANAEVTRCRATTRVATARW